MSLLPLRPTPAPSTFSTPASTGLSSAGSPPPCRRDRRARHRRHPPSATAAANPATVLVLGYVDLASVPDRPDRLLRSLTRMARGSLPSDEARRPFRGAPGWNRARIEATSPRAPKCSGQCPAAFGDATGGATLAPTPRQTDWGRGTSAAVNVAATGGAPAAAGAIVHRACRVSFMVQSYL